VAECKDTDWITCLSMWICCGQGRRNRFICQYCSVPLSQSFHQCSLLIQLSITDAI